MKKNWKLWTGLAVTTLIVVLLAVIPAAVADSSEDEGAAPPSTPPNTNTVCENFAAKVAANLGVSVDTLKNAVINAGLQMVDEALANGTITEEQAERMRERIQEGAAAGCLRWFGWRCGGPMGCIGKAVENGIITEEQADQIETLARQIRQQIRERIQNGFLGEAVENGILSQEQADQIHALCEQVRNQMRENCGRGGGRGHGCGPFGGGNGQ